MTNWKHLLVTAYAALITIPNAYAWNRPAHEAIAAAADQLLTPPARTAISTITTGGSLIDAATWMDEKATREQWPQMNEWHYINMQVCHPKKQSCPDGQCAPQKITEARDTLTKLASTLRSPTSKAQSEQALKVLVHLIADVHQPLHSSDNHDAGGNAVTIANRRCGPAHQCSLHEYWDSSLPKAFMRGKSIGEVASMLTSDPAVLSDSDSPDPWTWAQEAHDQAIRSAYTFTGFACNQGPIKKGSVDQAYDHRARDVVEIQMAKAALRLARTINSIYE